MASHPALAMLLSRAPSIVAGILGIWHGINAIMMMSRLPAALSESHEAMMLEFASEFIKPIKRARRCRHTMTAAPRPCPRRSQLRPPPPRPVHQSITPAQTNAVSPPACPAPPQHAASLSDPQVGRGNSCLTDTSLEGEHHRWPTGGETASRSSMEPAAVVSAPAEAALR
eukprot:SAG22_NODE_183_length_16031_cov_36.647000_18_plen_169_part_01